MYACVMCPDLMLHLLLELIYWVVNGLVFRLRSVKMEQRKLNDQANSLVDLAKVSCCPRGGRSLSSPVFSTFCVLQPRCMPGHWSWFPEVDQSLQVSNKQTGLRKNASCMLILVCAPLRFWWCGMEMVTLDSPG